MKNKFIKYLLVIIVYLGILLTATHDIFGIVLDSITKEPIKDINVYIKNQNIGTTTNKEGYFYLSLADLSINSINLNIQRIGYEEVVLLVDLNNKKIDLGEIFLVTKLIQIEPIHVHSKNIINSKQISDIKIGGLELNENLKGNIATTLSNYPNIGINSFGIVTSKPSLRGFSGDRFLLTKDGIETGDLSQSSIDHVITLDMGEVSHIEVIRGPKSLLYGPNAIGGVVNTTISGNPKTRADKFTTKFILGSESYNSNKLSFKNQGMYGNLLFYIPKGNTQLNLSINNRTTENQTSPIGVLNNTNSNTTSYKIGFTNYNDVDYVNFVIENYRMNYGIPPTTSGHTTGIDIPLIKKTFQVNYHKDISYKNFTNFDWKYNLIEYQHEEIIPDSDDIESELELAKKTNNLKIEISSKNFLLGSEFNIRNFKSYGINETPVTDEKNISIYGFYEKQIHSFGFDILSSFRFGYFSIVPKYYNYTNGVANLILKDENGIPILDEENNPISLVRSRKFKNFSFSIGLRKQFNKFEFNTWIMHTMRPPRVEELYSDGPHLASYAFEIGNPNLKSEKIYGIESSIGYKSNLFNFSLVTFYNYSPYYYQMTKDGNCEDAWSWDPNSGDPHPCPGASYIDWGSAPLGWLYIYSPKGNKVIIQGFESDLGYHINQFTIKYNLSFVQGDNETLKMPLTFMTPMKQRIELNYNKKFMNYKIRLSKIHEQNRLGQFETYTPEVLLTDFIVSYSYNKHNITVQFNNIFDEIYYNHLSRIKAIMPEPGMNIHFVYKILI